MFSSNIANELKRRIKKLSNRLTHLSDPTQSLEQALYPDRTEDEETKTAVETAVKKVSLVSTSKGFTPMLTGKIKTTSRTDLLQLENASLEAWLALLEEENKQLEAVVAAADQDNTPAALAHLEEAHRQLAGVNQQLQMERRQAAVDLVESVFRSLNARPPPRVRTDSVRSRNSSASLARSSRSSSMRSWRSSDASSAGPSSAPVRAATMRATMSSLPTIEDVEEEPELVEPTRRRTSLIGAVPLPVKSFSVFKINKLWKNKPHRLEVDARTASLSIMDANSTPKMELTRFNLRGVKRDGKIMSIIFSLSLSATGQSTRASTSRRFSKSSREELHMKKYKFPDVDKAQEFQQLVETYILAAARNMRFDSVDFTKSGSVSMLRRPESLDSITSGASSAAAAPLPYKPSPIRNSHIAIPEELSDVIDAVAENLARRWSDDRAALKDGYWVDAIPPPSTPRMRLKEQLRMFMGHDSKKSQKAERYRGLSYLFAENFIRDILHLGYKIAKQDSSAPRTGSMADMVQGDLNEIVKQLALDSAERWAMLALQNKRKREKNKHAKASTTLSVGGTDLGLDLPRISMDSVASSSAFAMRIVPPDAKQDDAHLDTGSNGVRQPSSSVPQPVGQLSGPPTPTHAPSKSAALLPSMVGAGNTPTPSPSTPSNGSASDTPAVDMSTPKMHLLVPFESLARALQEDHIADATEVIRSVLEFSFTIQRAAAADNSGAAE